METVGKILKSARIEQNLSLDDIEKATSIRRRYLEAIENDDYENAPGDVFVKGIIRTYGNYLGLNGTELVDIYKAETAGKVIEDVKSEGIREVSNVKLNISLKQERNFGEGNGKINFAEYFSVKKIAVAAVAVCVLAGGYFGYKMLDSVTVFPSEPAVSETEKLPQAKMPAVKNDKITVEMLATDKCWLEVKADGKEIFVGMLQPNDKKNFEAKDKLIIKYGNIGAVDITVNGEKVSTQGEHGVAVKTYIR